MTDSQLEAKNQVIAAGKRLVEAGLIARTWGNISARISDTEFVITPSGKAYETLTPADIVTVKISDCSYEGSVKPSSEKGVHAAAYRLRPAVNFVIHTHQTYGSCMSILGQDILDFTECDAADKQILGDIIPCASYGMFSTDKLIHAVGEQIQNHPSATAVLMKYHGALCMGANLENAFQVSRALETVCSRRYHQIVKLSEISHAKESDITIPEKVLCDTLFQSLGYSCVLHAKTPYILRMSQEGRTMRPYLDDLAQIAGVSIKCVDADSLSAIIAALKHRNAVLIRGMGAICTGMEESDVQAVCMVLEKGCQAALLAKNAGYVKPLSWRSAYLDRKVYVTSYSRLKG